MNRARIVIKAMSELGLRQVCLYAVYQLGVKSGFYRHMRLSAVESGALQRADLTDFVDHLRSLFPGEDDNLVADADLICQGQFRPFGSELQPLVFSDHQPLVHWTEYEVGRAKIEGDLRIIWEPARFGWAFTLAQAYTISKDERYPQAFWRLFEDFLVYNPPFLGPQWISAQEAGLRIQAFIFADQAFADSPESTNPRRQVLGQAIADHARRIQLTLLYARSQNNNHLVSEAVGLFSASVFLLKHPQADKWRKQGWRWFNWAIQHQVAENGSYVQHSTNYHRLMLALAVWMHALAETQAQALPNSTMQLLSAAVHWLQALIDPQSGRVPNLGANDGSNILPLAGIPIEDYRPIIKAASKAFKVNEAAPSFAEDLPRIENATSHAYLRVAKFFDRPSHADQLHFDLWWQGQNITLDAGSFSYSAPPPWTNALNRTQSHNTLTINGLDQMVAVGRFLWLDWAQAQVSEQIVDEYGRLVAITAWHNGYRRLGYMHCRSVTAREDDSWVIDDKLFPTRNKTQAINAQCHWLLPDLPYEINQHTLSLSHPKGKIQLSISGADSLAIIRAGKYVFGNGEDQPTLGWVSPTYTLKQPALALIASAQPATVVSFSTFIKLTRTN